MQVLKYILAVVRLILVLSWCIIFLIILLVALVVGINVRIRHGIAKSWAKLVCITLGFKIVVNKTKIPSGVLILPNHRSWIDIPLIFSIAPATIIAKREISKWPVIGWAFTAIDAILVDRSNMGSLITTFKKVKKKILSNRTVIIFPEGTICKGPETGNFKSGAFRLAAENEIRIVPVAFEFKDRKLVWKNGGLLIFHFLEIAGKLRSIIKVEIGTPLSSTDENWLLTTTKNWMDERILAMRKEWDS